MTAKHPTRISRVKPSSWLVYAAPGGGRIHRVFDTATANGSLVGVPFTHQNDWIVRLETAPASDIWLEHDDMTIDPKPECSECSLQNMSPRNYQSKLIDGDRVLTDELAQLRTDVDDMRKHSDRLNLWFKALGLPDWVLDSNHPMPAWMTEAAQVNLG